MNTALFFAALGAGYLITRAVVAAFRVDVPVARILDTPPILLHTVCVRCGADLGDVATMHESIVEQLCHDLLACQKVNR